MIHSSDYHKSTALSFHLVIIIVYVSVSYPRITPLQLLVSVIGLSIILKQSANFCLVLEPVIVMSGCLVLYLPPNNG